MKLSLSPMRSHPRIMLSIKRALAVPHQDFDLPGTACRLWYYHCIAMISRHGHIPGVTSSQRSSVTLPELVLASAQPPSHSRPVASSAPDIPSVFLASFQLSLAAIKLSLNPVRSHLRIMLSNQRALAVPHQDVDLPGTACRLWHCGIITTCSALISLHYHIPRVSLSVTDPELVLASALPPSHSRPVNSPTPG